MKKIIKFSQRYLFFIGLILFALILSKINIGGLFQNIKEINPLYLFLALFLSFPIIFIKAACWNYLKRQQGIKYNLKDSILMYYSGTYAGFVTPGRIGELTKVAYLKNDGHPIGKSLVTVILDRITDFIFLFIFAAVSSLFFFHLINKGIWISLGIIFLSLILFIIFLKPGLAKIFLKKLFYIFVPLKYQKPWKTNFQDFINDLKIYKLKNYLIIFLITALSWFCYYLQISILAKGLSINIPFFYFATALTIAGLITLIPVSVSGIGTRDASLILLLGPFLVSKEKIVALSAMILFVALFASLVGLICWFIKPIKF